MESSAQNTKRKLKGKRLVLASFIFLTVTLLLSFTPILWRLGGKQSESYPELIALFYGLPMALIFVALALARLFLLKR
ncbi:hypothetical protein MHM87_19595 [Alteromonas sp. Cnat3-28]|uniref:hypothetical protein n=1 Tax=Alteromonas sp. Cnat3-28 TaxID=2917729 RepID=UPI001EF49905|nr:hypothetical protein [Alteromonas sp. Cnat3-28]MCG7647781.1 hypothetical protein [Alteromonas sp. Cnat3-28]